MVASIFTDQVPGAPNVSDATFYTLGCEWMSDVDATWTGIRVYTPTTQPSVDYQVIGYEVTSQTTGTEIARGTGTWAAGGVWSSIDFDTPVPITAGQHYVAAYTTHDFFVLTSNGLFAAVVNGDLTAFASGDAGAFNGRIHVGGDAFPETGSGDKANYFADPLIGTTPPPTVITISPAVEIDTARPLAITKRRTIGRALERDIARPLAHVRPGQRDLEIAIGAPTTSWTLGAPAVGWALSAPTI